MYARFAIVKQLQLKMGNNENNAQKKNNSIKHLLQF